MPTTGGQTIDVSTVGDAAIAPGTVKTGGRGLSFLIKAATLLLLIPVALYFWFIHRYGVNAIYYDQWNDVALLTHTRYLVDSYSGHTTIGMLWYQHNESRTFFPNLITLALGALTHLNTLTEVYLSAILHLIAVLLIILAHRRDVARTRLIFYLPVVFLMLTLGQFENILFGYEISWCLVIAALAAVIFLLDLPKLGWLVLAAAIGMAVIGSYSALQGLLIWPAGLVVLFWKHRPRVVVLTWLISAIATTGLYFYHFDFGAAAGGSKGYVLTHPLAAAKFFFFELGDILGKPLPQGAGGSDPAIVIAGIAVFLLAVACLAIYGRRGSLSRSPVGPALICFGIIFALWTTLGRTYVGLWAASQSRYVTEDLFILVGCYLCLLEGWPARVEERVTEGSTVDLSRGANQLSGTLRPERRRRFLVGLRVAAILLIVVDVRGGISNGLSHAPDTRKLYQLDNLVAAHATNAPDSLLKSALYPNTYFDGANIRNLAEAAKRDHLSFFATSEASRLARMSLPKTEYSPPKPSVARPTDGAVLRGREYLVATVSMDYPLTSVNFQIGSSGGQQVELVHGHHFLYGWLGILVTTNLPNGPYTVQSIAKDITGHSSTSHAVQITIKN
jgi:hypothetical protein